VSKSYVSPARKVQAVMDVSLALAAGRFAAVQGASGCGKTTLLLMAGGLLRPDAGTVRVAGVEPYSLSSEGRARFRAATLGFVFQQFHLVPYLSVIDNVLVATLARDGSQPRTEGHSTSAATARSLRRADALLERFRLSHRRLHIPGELSSGEQQRVALARALMNEPQLLLADEPTGNLDRENADIVLGALREFATNGGSVLLVTHDDHAAARADHVVRMREGRIVL
jgi:ABC-type lipoprotein export system ATPase subunit